MKPKEVKEIFERAGLAGKGCEFHELNHKSVVARESQHTQLPWHVAGGHAEYVEAANRLRVADCQIVQKPFVALPTREMEANAEFIVRACNTFHALVEALQAALPALEQGKEFQGEVLEVIAQVREALEKAGA